MSLFLVGARRASSSAAVVALVVSVVRRRAGVGAARVAGRGRRRNGSRRWRAGTDADADGSGSATRPTVGREFPPALDLIAPIVGVVGLLGAAAFTGGAVWLTAARLIVGAAFLGVVSDAMLLGHWYLTQPGLPREPLKELVRWCAYVCRSRCSCCCCRRG